MDEGGRCLSHEAHFLPLNVGKHSYPSGGILKRNFTGARIMVIPLALGARDSEFDSRVPDYFNIINADIAQE